LYLGGLKKIKDEKKKKKQKTETKKSNK